MLSFKGYINENEDFETISLIEESFGSIENFLTEGVRNIIDPIKYQKANKIAQRKSDEVTSAAKTKIEDHLKNYGRTLHDTEEDSDDITHLNDKDLFDEREKHLNHLKHLATHKPDEYKKVVKDAQSRLPINPHGQNAKTSTMTGEFVNGKEVVASVSNRGMSGSVNKISKNGKVKRVSTCVNSKQSCHGEGPNRVGAPCLGMNGCAGWSTTKTSNTVQENMKTMKAHAKNGAHYGYNGEDGKPVSASPHLDYATLEHASLVNAARHAKKETERTGKPKIAVFRQNTTNEGSSMHHDQIKHNLPDDLQKHIKTNNYSATIAKGKYDPKNPSDRSTHDGVDNNTDFSVKGPEVSHTDKGKVVGFNPSSNVKEAHKALAPEVDEKGKVTRPAQNIYMVAGGHHEGQRLRYPKDVGVKDPVTKKKLIDPDTGLKVSSKKFHVDNAPESFKPFHALNKLKTARIYHNEKKLSEGEPKDFHHPDGWGHETHYDPHTKKHRTFEYQDYHVHANSPKPDEKGNVDFGTLNDNVGSDDRKPKEHEKKYGKSVIDPKTGKSVKHEVGTVHVSAATASTSNVGADGTLNTDKNGKIVGDKNGVANDPFTFPIQHHIDKKDETRINLNHPKHQFEAEEAERKSKDSKPNIHIPNYEPHPETKAERGELK